MKSHITEAITTLAVSALWDAKRAVSTLGDSLDSDTLRHESGAVAFVLQGFTKIQTAYSVYLVSCEEAGEWDVFESIVHQYDVFTHEITDNLATDHSHQWSSIEAERLFELSEGTPFEIKRSE